MEITPELACAIGAATCNERGPLLLREPMPGTDCCMDDLMRVGPPSGSMVLLPSDKFTSPHAPPEGEARELLVVLVEECAEAIRELLDVQQRATKALRFGLAEIQPGQAFTNTERLAHEIGDVEEVVLRLKQRGVVDPDAIVVGRERKRRQLAKFMQCQSPPAPTDSVAGAAPSSNENQ